MWNAVYRPCPRYGSEPHPAGDASGVDTATITLKVVRGVVPDVRELQAMELIRVAYVWRVCRQSLNMDDMDASADQRQSHLFQHLMLVLARCPPGK